MPSIQTPEIITPISTSHLTRWQKIKVKLKLHVQEFDIKFAVLNLVIATIAILTKNTLISSQQFIPYIPNKGEIFYQRIITINFINSLILASFYYLFIFAINIINIAIFFKPLKQFKWLKNLWILILISAFIILNLYSFQHIKHLSL